MKEGQNTNKNNNTQLSNDGLKKVAGGAQGTVNKQEYDKACSSFICKKCGRDHNHHKIDSDDQCIEWIFINNNGRWLEEWPGHQLDCNHCKFFHRTSGIYGECLKDRK